MVLVTSAMSFAEYLDEQGMRHIRGKPLHPQTQGKIERYHRTMKNIIKLENYYSPDELRYRLTEFIDYYNHARYHESPETHCRLPVIFTYP